MDRKDLKVGETYQASIRKGLVSTVLMITDTHVFYSYVDSEYSGQVSTSIEDFVNCFEPIKKDFYHVYYFWKQAQRPTFHAQLFESKEDFLTRGGHLDKEEFYHWIKLVRVDV